MAWTNPTTRSAGDAILASDQNIWVNNFRMGQPVFTNEAARDAALTSPEEGMIAYLTAPTVPAATGSTSTQVPTGITTIYNGSVWVCVTEIGARSSVAASTTSTSYTSTLTGDTTALSVTLVTGTTALVSQMCQAYVGTATTGRHCFAVSGATTLAATDANSAVIQSTFGNTHQATWILSGLTAGTNTFTLQYKQSSGTLNIDERRIYVRGIA